MAQKAKSLYYPVLQELSAKILLQFDINSTLEYLDKLIFVKCIFILLPSFLVPYYNYNVVIEYNGQFQISMDTCFVHFH